MGVSRKYNYSINISNKNKYYIYKANNCNTDKKYIIEYNAIKLYYNNSRNKEEIIKYKDLVSQMNINGSAIEIDLSSPNELYLVAVVPKYKINYIKQLYIKLLSYIKNNKLTFDVLWKYINNIVSHLFNDNCIDISLYYSNKDGVYAHIVIDPFNQIEDLKEYFLY